MHEICKNSIKFHQRLNLKKKEEINTTKGIIYTLYEKSSIKFPRKITNWPFWSVVLTKTRAPRKTVRKNCIWNIHSPWLSLKISIAMYSSVVRANEIRVGRRNDRRDRINICRDGIVKRQLTRPQVEHTRWCVRTQGIISRQSYYETGKYVNSTCMHWIMHCWCS